MRPTLRDRILHTLKFREELATTRDLAAEVEASEASVQAWLDQLLSEGAVTRTFVGLYGPSAEEGEPR